MKLEANEDLFSSVKEDMFALYNDLSAPNEPAPQHTDTENKHQYYFTEREIQQLFRRPVYKEIINSHAFKRLKKIRFLGSIDYSIGLTGANPSKINTRFQHSLGVAKLALEYAELKSLPTEVEINCVVAALLHDIGHAPLSHSLESVFSDKYQVNHHVICERIIRGDVAIGEQLHQILLKWQINPFEIMSIISGVASGPYKVLFGYPINIDTIEGILRSTTYRYKNISHWSPSALLAALAGPLEQSTSLFDRFWQLKHEVYNELINGKVGVLSDFIAQQYMKDHIADFSADSYYMTEDELTSDHDALFKLLSSIVTDSKTTLDANKDIVFKKRTFYIDKSIPLRSHHDFLQRYTQSKQQVRLQY